MKLLAAVALVLVLTVPVIACVSAAGWKDVIARALVKTNEAWSYRSTGNSTGEVEGRTVQSSTESEHVGNDFRVKYTTSCGAEAPSWDSDPVQPPSGCELEEFLTTISNDSEHVFLVNAGNYTTTGNVSVTVVSSGGCRPGWVEWVVIGNKAYIRSSDSPEWQECQARTQGQPVPPPTLAYPAATVHPTSTDAPTPEGAPPTSPPAASTASPGTIASGTLVGPRETRPPSTPAPSPTPYGNSTWAVIANVSLARELEYLDWLIDVDKLPAEYVDGVNCSHFSGRVNMDGYTDMVIERRGQEQPDVPTPPPEVIDTQRRSEFVVELWIDDDEHIRQMTVDVRFPTPDPDTGEDVWNTSLSTTRYFDFNQPITIEPPD